MPHRDDLEAAHARIAALERDKAEQDRRIDELESELTNKERALPAVVEPPEPPAQLPSVELAEAKSEDAVRALVKPVDDRALVKAVDQASKLRGRWDRKRRLFSWSGEVDKCRLEITARKVANGWLLEGSATRPHTAVIWLAAMAGGTLFGAAGAVIFGGVLAMFGLAALLATTLRDDQIIQNGKAHLEQMFGRAQKQLSETAT